MSLAETKRRINSIQSTAKITNAMKLIASSKLNKQTKKFQKNKVFFNEYYAAIASLLALTTPKDFGDLINNNNDKTLWIIITSNLGLCGGYNVNLYKEINKQIKDGDTLAIFGKKGIEHFKKIANKVSFLDMSLINLDQQIEVDKCLFIANDIYERFKNSQFGKIKICYTKFINAIAFKPNIFDVFPITQPIDLNKQNDKPPQENDYDFEPDKKTIIKAIIPEYISMVLNASLNESILSECAMRRNAMDTATTNATDLIAKYKLKYNRMRQSIITNEIIEIIAGNEEN